MVRRGVRVRFFAHGVTALFGAVAACSEYGTEPDPIAPIVPTGPAGSSDGGPDGGPILDPDSGAPTVPCNGATDLATNAKHCGSCGHDCLGGACAAGKCQPVVVADGVAGAQYLRASGDLLFATGTEGMVRVPKAGGEVVALFSGGEAVGIALDSTHAYCVTSTGVQRVPFAGGAPLLIKSTQRDEVAVDGSGIYVCGLDGYDVRRFDLNGNGSVVIKDVEQCESLAVAAGEVFAGGKRMVRSVSGKEVEIGTVSARRLALDAQSVYSIQAGSPSVHRTMRTGSASDELVKGVEPVEEGDIAVDETHVYWTTGRALGGVYRAPTRGGAAEPIATGVPFPKGIVVDDVAVYWTERDASRIMKRAK